MITMDMMNCTVTRILLIILPLTPDFKSLLKMVTGLKEESKKAG